MVAGELRRNHCQVESQQLQFRGFSEKNQDEDRTVAGQGESNMDAPPIEWRDDWDEAFREARKENKVVLIDVEKEN
jgi:hypothetical protein